MFCAIILQGYLFLVISSKRDSEFLLFLFQAQPACSHCKNLKIKKKEKKKEITGSMKRLVHRFLSLCL